MDSKNENSGTWPDHILGLKKKKLFKYLNIKKIQVS